MQASMGVDRCRDMFAGHPGIRRLVLTAGAGRCDFDCRERWADFAAGLRLTSLSFPLQKPDWYNRWRDDGPAMLEEHGPWARRAARFVGRFAALSELELSADISVPLNVMLAAVGFGTANAGTTLKSLTLACPGMSLAKHARGGVKAPAQRLSARVPAQSLAVRVAKRIGTAVPKPLGPAAKAPAGPALQKHAAPAAGVPAAGASVVPAADASVAPTADDSKAPVGDALQAPAAAASKAAASVATAAGARVAPAAEAPAAEAPAAPAPKARLTALLPHLTTLTLRLSAGGNTGAAAPGKKPLRLQLPLRSLRRWCPQLKALKLVPPAHPERHEMQGLGDLITQTCKANVGLPVEF